MHHTMRHLRLIKQGIERPVLDTRRHPRFETTIRVRREGLVVDRRGNVSARGFCFESYEELGVGEWVELSVRLPGSGDWVQVWGRVLGCHRRLGRYQVRGWFARIRRRDKRTLRQWLECHCPFRLTA